MSTCGLLFQWANTIKIQLRVLIKYKVNTMFIIIKTKRKKNIQWQTSVWSIGAPPLIRPLPSNVTPLIRSHSTSQWQTSVWSTVPPSNQATSIKCHPSDQATFHKSVTNFSLEYSSPLPPLIRPLPSNVPPPIRPLPSNITPMIRSDFRCA